MIETKLNEAARPNDEISFPILAESIKGEYCSGNFVVLFTKERAGMVVHDPEAIHGIGHYANNFVSIYDISLWRILPHNSEVILTQNLE